MTRLITDHVFRLYAAGAYTANAQGVQPGMCGWLGTCNRPESDHAAARSYQQHRPRLLDDATAHAIAQAYDDGASVADLAAAHSISLRTVYNTIRRAGGTIRQRPGVRP